MRSVHEDLNGVVKDGRTEFWVGSGTDPVNLSKAISAALQTNNALALIAMGAGAVNQAMKGLAIANRNFASSGGVITTIATMVDVQVKNVQGVSEEKTAMRFLSKVVPYEV